LAKLQDDYIWADGAPREDPTTNQLSDLQKHSDDIDAEKNTRVRVCGSVWVCVQLPELVKSWEAYET